MLDGSRAWGVPAVGTSWWIGRTTPTGRGFSIHKEQPRLVSSQWTGKQNWHQKLNSERMVHTETLLQLC